MASTHDLIVYDGVCLLCSRSIRFVATRDKDARFRFVPLQSAYGRHLAAHHGISTDAPETFVAIIGGRPLFRSEGALAVLSRLPRYGWARILKFVPRRLRDALYDLVARHRYRWFGRFDSCPRPPPFLAERVIEDVPEAAAH